MAAIVFCLHCASHQIDVCGWTPGGQRATLRCCGCGHEQVLEGFSVGRLGTVLGYEEAEHLAQVAAGDVALYRGDREWNEKFLGRLLGGARAVEDAAIRQGLAASFDDEPPAGLTLVQKPRE